MISDFRMEAGFICSVKSRAKVFFFFFPFFFSFYKSIIYFHIKHILAVKIIFT